MRTRIALVIGCWLLAGEARAGSTGYVEHWVPRGGERIYAREYAGAEPTIVLMHGFPDDLQLYDRLVPHLRSRRVVLFDFLGWGQSDKPSGYPYTFENQKGDLDAVLTQLSVDRPILVAHDASGPAAINWTLDHRSRVGALGLLNTFYGATPAIVPPEAILMFSDLVPFLEGAQFPGGASWTFERLSQAIVETPRISRWLYQWQVGGFIRDERIRRTFVRKLWAGFGREPSSIPAFRALNRDLTTAVLANTGRVPELASLDRPVRIIFGAEDPYLNRGVAENFHALFPKSELFLLPTARHYVQVDDPAEVARLLLSLPAGS